jgi:hypothetical protein
MDPDPDDAMVYRGCCASWSHWSIELLPMSLPYWCGFIPDLVLWLSYFYTSTELPVRLSFFWTALNLTTIVASLLAFGIFHLDNAHGLEGWRWLFLIEVSSVKLLCG